MYLVFIDVPFQRTADDVARVTGEWGVALGLLRDSLGGRFGQIGVAAPEWAPDRAAAFDQEPIELHAGRDGIRFISLGDKAWRLRRFWRHYGQVRRRAAEAVAAASAVHAGVNDPFMPWAPTGLNAGVRAGKFTVFVLDTDIILQSKQLAKRKPLGGKLKAALGRRAYFRHAKRGVSTADLALLKGQQLMDRFARYSANARSFYNTSYSEADIIPAGELARKQRDVQQQAGRSLRLLSLGRLSPRKGTDHSVRAVAAAIGRGARLSLDIIGSGVQQAGLERLIAELGVGEHIRLLGSRPYGPELLAELRQYDVFIFTPLGEDTPRALFDAYCAGLSSVGYDIPYNQSLFAEAAQPAPVPIGDVEALAAQLVDLERNRPRLAACFASAASTARQNTQEQWYARRAEWTFEAYDRHMKERAR